MGAGDRRDPRGLVYALVTSTAWILLDLASGGPQALGTASAAAHALLALTGVVLIPFVAWGRRWACAAALGLGALTLAYLLATAPERMAGDGTQRVAPAVWALLQTPVMYLAYRAVWSGGES